MNKIYLRTSTQEQNPENQLSDCLALLKKLNITVYEVIEDKTSGWKDVERKGFDKLYSDIIKGKIRIIVCWDLDRLYRNRKRLIKFFEICKIYKCKVYSFRQQWLEELNNMPEPFNEIMHSQMLQIMGWLAEEESNKKSDRTKSAVRWVEGKPTTSYKGNRWGRKPLSKKVIEKIIEYRKNGLSIREICEVVEYWDKNNNKKKVSVGTVHKILTKNHIT